MLKIVEETRERFGDKAAEVAGHIARRAVTPEQALRYFSVGFRDGRVRIVFPDPKDPLRYEQQIVASGSNNPAYEWPQEVNP